MFRSGEKMSGFNGRNKIATHVHLHKFVALCAGEERGQQYTVPRAAIYVPWPLYGAAGVSAMQHAVARDMQRSDQRTREVGVCLQPESRW